MGFFSFLSELGKKAGTTNDKVNNETNHWEEHCESCGELLEDCECDWRKISEEDTSRDWIPRDQNILDLWDE